MKVHPILFREIQDLDLSDNKGQASGWIKVSKLWSDPMVVRLLSSGYSLLYFRFIRCVMLLLLASHFAPVIETLLIPLLDKDCKPVPEGYRLQLYPFLLQLMLCSPSQTSIFELSDLFWIVNFGTLVMSHNIMHGNLSWNPECVVVSSTSVIM